LRDENAASAILEEGIDIPPSVCCESSALGGSPPQATGEPEGRFQTPVDMEALVQALVSLVGNRAGSDEAERQVAASELDDSVLHRLIRC